MSTSDNLNLAMDAVSSLLLERIAERGLDKASPNALLFSGSDDEDFTNFCKDFEIWYVGKVFGKAIPNTGDRYSYKDELAAQRHMASA
jgi:hypothetical protein